jgi:hypothetical protein
MKKEIKSIIYPALIGGLSLSLLLAGCGQQGQDAQNSTDSIASSADEKGFFLLIEQTGKNPDTYQLLEKHPSATTRAILRDMEGNEKILTEDELKKLAEVEAAKVEAGTSQLTQSGAGGLGLGETILAGAAGALIGGMIANKLAGNSNFQQHQQQINQSAAEGNRQAESNNRAARNTATTANQAGAKPSNSVRRSLGGKRRR